MDANLINAAASATTQDERMSATVTKKAMDVVREQAQGELQLVATAALPPVTATKGNHVNLWA